MLAVSDDATSAAGAAPAPDEPTFDDGDAHPGGMDHRRERIRVETERHRIVGCLTLARDGYRSRVSDVLNAPERDFLTLTEVTVEPLSGGPVELHSYLTLARRHIVFAVAAPED
jgi:hypothetical protein